MTKRTDEASVVVDSFYDQSNRLTQRKKSGSSTDSETFVYDGLGRMITAEKGSTGSPDAVSRSVFAYDSLSRVLSESQAISQGAAKVVTYEYDKTGNRTEVIYHFAATTAGYAYDSRDRGISIDNGSQRLADYTWIGSAINQRDTTCDYPGTTKPKFKTAFQRDGILRVTKVDNQHLTLDQATAGYNDLGEFTYTYDAASNPLTAAVAKLPSPQEGTGQVIASEEPKPTVALAATGRTRAGASPISGALSAPPSSSLFAKTEPAPTDPNTAVPSLLNESSAPPVEAMPETTPTNRFSRRVPTVVTPALRDIALPTEEATVQGQESGPRMTPNVSAASSDSLRAATEPPRDPAHSEGQSELFVLLPKESAEPSESRDSLTGRLYAEDAPSAGRPRQAEAQPARPAIMAKRPDLALNIPTETDPPPQAQPPVNTHGIIEGRVTDARTDTALAGAMVRLVLSHDEDVVAMSDQDGRYLMAVPQTPDFFALSASKEEYLPGTANIRLAAIAEKPATVNFTLSPLTESVIPLEEEPDVHHLGNDRFEGRINSQFQKQSEGRRYRATFHLTSAQIDTQYTRAEVSLMAKGVQCPHQIRINGHLLRKRLDRSPRKGGFGPFKAQFRPSWLKPGKNRFKITAQSCRGDLDDFEFVNVQIRLTP